MTEQPLAEFHDDFGMSGERKPPAPEHPGIDRSRWGLFPDVNIEAYHRGDFGGLKTDEITLSQGQMRRLLDETPLDFAFNNSQLNPEGAEERILESVAARRGDVVHQLALGKGKGFAVGDFADWRTKEAKSFKERAVADGLVPIKRTDFEEAEIMAEVIVERIEEALQGASYQTEVAFLYQEMTQAGPVWVRGLMDVWCEELGVILDPKVTAMLYDGKVERHLVSMGWDRQAALYPHAVGTILGKPGHIKFADLMIKPEAPFTSRMVRLEKAWEASAVKQCRIAMERFGACLYAGRWPGFEETAFVQLPVWEDKRREAMELGEAV
jgi:hypothetical protein